MPGAGRGCPPATLFLNEIAYEKLKDRPNVSSFNAADKLFAFSWEGPADKEARPPSEKNAPAPSVTPVAATEDAAQLAEDRGDDSTITECET